MRQHDPSLMTCMTEFTVTKHELHDLIECQRCGWTFEIQTQPPFKVVTGITPEMRTLAMMRWHREEGKCEPR